MYSTTANAGITTDSTERRHRQHGGATPRADARGARTASVFKPGANQFAKRLQDRDLARMENPHCWAAGARLFGLEVWRSPITRS
jgi:hypothetical protein